MRKFPTYQQVDEMQREIEMLHAENALKLTQILDLEQLIWELRAGNFGDGWCWSNGCEFIGANKLHHSSACIKARQATEPFWKKVDTESKR